MSKIEYKPLPPDSIRLLELQSSPTPSSEIRCKILHKTLSKCDFDLVEHYIALSYVWGSPNEQKTIYVQGHEFNVTRNLFNALRDLREETRVVTLWVDAICINQQDIQERNQQVSLMAFIYSIARHTVIYLGESNEQIDGILRRLSGEPAQPKSNLPPSADLDRLVAKDILARPWFDRVWIFQELVLSKDPWVQCGNCRLKWSFLCNFLTPKIQDSTSILLGGKQKSPEQQGRGFDRLQSLIDARTNYQVGLLKGTPQVTLMGLLSTRRGLGVTDPRDIIYGHMGVATLPITTNKYPKQKGDSFRMLTKLDYAKTVAQVFNDFAFDILEWSQSYDMLSFVEDIDPSQRRKGLASWAPDWTTNPTNQPERIRKSISEYQPKVNNRIGALSVYQLIADSHLLVAIARGKKVIKSVSEVIPWDASEIIDTAAYRAKFSLDFVDHIPLILEDPQELYKPWRFISKLYFEALSAKISPSDESCFQLSKPQSEFFDVIALERVRQEGSDWRNIYDILFWHTSQRKDRSILAQRRIALLEDSFYGVVPSSARSGDVITMLTNADIEGRSATFVIRPCVDIDRCPEDELEDVTNTLLGIVRGYKNAQRLLSEECGHYHLVGECSVQADAFDDMKGDFHVIALH